MSFQEELKTFRARYPAQCAVSAGAKFRYVLAGEGPRTLVFLNGGTNVLELWMGYLEALAPENRVLLFDYPRELRTNQQLVTGMHLFFKAQGIQKPVLIGASDGSMVAQLFTQKYPQEVGGLVLLSAGGMDAGTLASLKRKYRAAPLMLSYMKHCNYEKLKPKLIEGGVAHAKHEPPQRQAYAREMFTQVFAEYTQEKDVHVTGLLVDLLHQTPVTPADFAHLEGRVLLMLPTKDFFTPRMQEALVGLMPHPQVEWIEGGHIATVLRPELYLPRIRAFLAQLPRE